MKYFVIFLITISFFTVGIAYGIWLPQSPEKLLEESQVIFVGTITSANELELDQPTYNEAYQLILDEYTIAVEEFVKNPQDTDTIAVRQPTVSTPGRLLPFEGFEVGDRALFYIKSFDGINTYSKESFLIPEQCDTSSVIHKPRIVGSDLVMMQKGMEKKDNFTANHPIQFTSKRDMGTLAGISSEYHVFISKQVGKIYNNIVLNQTITADSQPCEWLSVAEWEFTPDVGNYLLTGRIYENTKNLPIGNKFFSVFAEPPLKQHAVGIPYDEIQCKSGFELVAKMPSADPKCVKPESVQELVIRGWASTNKSLELANSIKYMIDKNDNSFELQYSLNGATLESIVHDVDANSVRITLDESVGGNMIILLPYGLADTQIGQSDVDDSFFLLIDGEENLYGEMATETGRIITIWFPNGAHDIEIIRTSWM